MASERLIYDECAFKEKINQSVQPGFYQLYDGQFSNNARCSIPTGPRNTRTRNSSELWQTKRNDLVAAESLLKNLDLPASQCMKDRTLYEKNKVLQQVSLHQPQFCDNTLAPFDTRLAYSLQDYKEIDYGSNYFATQFPIIDHREFVFWGFNNVPRDGSSTRNIIKDNWNKR